MVTALTLPPMPHFKSFTLRLCLLRASALLAPKKTKDWYENLVKKNCDLGHLGTSWDILGHLGTSWDILGHLGTSWDILGHLGTSWDILGPRSGSPWPGSTWFPVSYLLDLPLHTSQRTRKIVVHKHIISPKPLSSQWASLSGPSKLEPDRMGLNGSNSQKILRAGLKISSISSTADKSPLP